MRGFDNLLSIGWLIFVDFCPNWVISLKLCNEILWEVKYRFSVTVYLHYTMELAFTRKLCYTLVATSLGTETYC